MKEQRSYLKKAGLLVLIGLMCLALVPVKADCASQSYKPTFISIGAASQGGAWYPLAVGMAELIKANIPGMNANAEATGASIENIKLLSNKKIELGMVRTINAYEAFNGVGDDFQGKPQPFLRTFWAGATQPYVMVVREDRNIKTFKDLKGKKIAAVMPRTSANRIYLEAVMKEIGMSWDDFQAQKITNYAETVEACKEGVLDGVWYPSSASAALIDLAFTTKIRYLNLDEATVTKLSKIKPFFEKYRVPKGKLPGQNEDLWALGSTELLVGREELDADLVYQMTKAVIGNTATMAKANPTGVEYNPQKAPTFKVIPYHPGAIKYYKEMGVWKE
jgi:uncharacterized protein